jgi:PAS domain S-box-containing protein
MTPQRTDARPLAAALADNIDALVQCVSPTGEVLFVNRAWKQRFGYSDDDLRTRTVDDLVSPAQRTHLSQMFARLFAGDDLHTVHTQLVARDASVVDLKGSLSRVLVNGTAIAALGLFTENLPAITPGFTVPVGKRVAMTARQQAVLQLFASGHTTKQVAAELDIAVKTVHNHLTTIYRLLDAQSLVQATMIAAQLGLVELAAPMR